MRMRTLLVSLIAATASAAIAAPANAHPTVRSDAVSAWNETAGDAALAACLAPTNNPLHESRMYAITHLAIHDAVNAIDRRSRPYAYDATAKRRTSPDAAVAAAARDVLVTLLEPASSNPLRIASTRRRSTLSKPTTRRPSARFRTVRRRRAGSNWDGPPPRPSSPSAPRTARTPRCSTRSTSRARRLVYGASHRVSTSRSPQAGARSPRSCSETARSSTRVRLTR